jgi:hypothetical protein
LPKWSEVKKWYPDKAMKHKADDNERETILDNSLSSSYEEIRFTWTVDRRFYAVQNDELREKYLRDYVKVSTFKSNLNLRNKHFFPCLATANISFETLKCM